MKPAYAVEVFVGTRVAHHPDVLMSIMCLKIIFLGTEPSKEVIEGWVRLHTQNVDILMSSVMPFLIPDELL